MACQSSIPATLGGFTDAVNAYMKSWNGLLNIIESAADLSLFLAMWFSSLEFDAQRNLLNFAMGYSTNDILIMISSLLSYGTAYCLAAIFYYVLFQMSAMLVLMITGMVLIANKRGGTGHGLFAIACGVIHALHFGYTVYINYIK